MSAKNVMLAMELALLVIQPAHGKDIPATNALEVRERNKMFSGRAQTRSHGGRFASLTFC